MPPCGICQSFVLPANSLSVAAMRRPAQTKPSRLSTMMPTQGR
jgi:hypothetical protein